MLSSINFYFTPHRFTNIVLMLKHKLFKPSCSLRRSVSSATISPHNATLGDQKEFRERALAEAIAREEEAKAKEKAIRETRSAMRSLISGLNETPSLLAKERTKSLQKELLNVDTSKQLDEELEHLIINNMSLPGSETSRRNWIGQSEPTLNQLRELLSPTSSQSTTSSFASEFPSLKPTPDYRPYSENELFLRHLAHARNSGNLGSKVKDAYFPSKDVKLPSSIKDITLKDLLAAGCHLGHSRSLWRPSTQPFIFGEYDGMLLIDLNATLSHLKRAAAVTQGIAKKGGLILYVGTSKKMEERLALEEAAKRSKGYFVSKRWIPGTITNFLEITKQLAGQHEAEVDLGDNLTGRRSTSKDVVKPDLVVITNPVENRNLLKECIKTRVPTIGLCDTNMEPSLLTYPIPCNDDSTRACSVILGALSRAAEKGVTERHEVFEQYKKSVI